MKYKTVIIGLGTIAHYHVAVLRRSEQFDLCAVCDLRQKAHFRFNPAPAAT